jgi:hypothetical protein
MSVRRGIGIGLLVILVLALLAVYGFAVYRLGYERGARAAGPSMMWEGSIPRMERGMMPRVWSRDGGFGLLGLMSLPGLLSGLGFAALVVLAVVGLVRLIAPAATASHKPPPGSGAGEGTTPS